MNINEWNFLTDKRKVAIEIYREIKNGEIPTIDNVLYNMEKHGFDKIRTTFLLRKLMERGTIVSDWYKIGNKYTEQFNIISPEVIYKVDKLYDKIYSE